jgi:hypothetical protein
VVEDGSNDPIANAKISTQPVSSTVFTDSSGRYQIDNVPVGEYSVQAEKDDFITAFEPATVNANVASNVVFELQVSTADNRPPTAPDLLSPEDNGLVESVEVTFQWDATDPENDPLTFTLELRNDVNEEVLIFEEIQDTTFTYSPLVLGAKYFWQVTATDDINPPVTSAVSAFEVIGAPEDNRFLFTRNIEGNNVIFSADADGTEFQLTSQNSNSFRPRRNVAAGRIAFFQTDGAELHIYTMKRDGSDIKRVTGLIRPNGFKYSELNFSWPPASDQLYFPSFDKLYRIRTNGQGLELVYQTPDGSFISEVDVSENSNIIALKTNDQNGYNVEIYTIDFSGNRLTTVLTGVDGATSGLDLSVTNNLVLYSYDISGFESANYRRLDARLFIYDIAQNTRIEISGDKISGTNDLEPIFSPSEAQVIFTNTSNDGISQRNVLKLEINFKDGTGEDRETLFENAFMPDWE